MPNFKTTVNQYRMLDIVAQDCLTDILRTRGVMGSPYTEYAIRLLTSSPG
ncbi:MAG TPA: hypothetical protein V6D12_01025 [Candidatus Obscuribacterales bacterium]